MRKQKLFLMQQERKLSNQIPSMSMEQKKLSIQSSGNDAFQSANPATLNHSQVTIGSVSTVLKEFQPSMPHAHQIGRQKNFINLMQPGDSNQQSRISQFESMNEDGISMNSNMMQSMSSLGGLGQPGHANLSAQIS
jgi:hypothetical protein